MDADPKTTLQQERPTAFHAGVCSALWVACLGCGETGCESAGQCAKNPEWKSPSNSEELIAYAEAMNLAIFRARKEIIRLQSKVDAMEPIFSQLVNLEQNR